MENERTANLDLKHYLQVVSKWLWLIILATAVAASAALLVSSRTTPIYEASATLLIREGGQQAGLDYNSVLMSERLAGTYSQMLKDAPVLDEVTTRLGLGISEEALARMITVETVRDTLLINLKVRNPDPALAANVANTAAQVFAEQHAQMGVTRYSSSIENLSNEIQQLLEQIQAAQEALDAERAKPFPDIIEVGRLEGVVVQYRSTYADLSVAYEQMRVAEAGGVEAISVADPAKPPHEPALPRKGLNTALAGVVGAMLATGAAFLIDYLDDSIKDEDDVQRVAHLPTLATVWRAARGEAAKGSLLMAAHPESAVAEAYRLLRTGVQFATLDAGDSAPVIVVSSAGPEEGKTTTAANLGASLAQIGKRVLLVDTDLRRPTLHTHFGLGNDNGLTSLFLERKPEAEAVICETGVEGLRLLPSGPVPANPAELLEYPRFGDILASLKEAADYVILDSPPVLSVADASILAQKANGLLLVVEPGKTRREALEDTVRRLRKVRARVLGVVLNKGKGRSGRYYDYHRAYSHSGERRDVVELPGTAPVVGIARVAAEAREGPRSERGAPSPAREGR